MTLLGITHKHKHYPHFKQFRESTKLTKTILYNLNPADNAVFGSMTGNFQEKAQKGKFSLDAWWFLDQLDGMEQQINTLSNLGLISTFIGMLTDSGVFCLSQDTSISEGYSVIFCRRYQKRFIAKRSEMDRKYN